ncbi:MAG: hypothetical protein D6798_11985 [Deltaproteobacteria bacterium]|nr:MAG: hypothetical protein D6798_11985 [Deltaproteobacteria bacterium]
MTPPFHEALDAVRPADLGPLASDVAHGRVHGIRLTPDAPPTWLLDPAPTDAPGMCKLWRVGGDRIHQVPISALRGALLQRLRSALAPYEGRSTVPPWVEIARLADVELRARGPQPLPPAGG